MRAVFLRGVSSPDERNGGSARCFALLRFAEGRFCFGGGPDTHEQASKFYFGGLAIRAALTALLAALAIVLVALIHFPLVPAAPFLEYDPADIPIFIGTFLFGPAAGLALTAVVCVIQGVTVSAASGPIGIIMHFLATGTFVLLAGNLYRAHRTRKAALLGLAAGTLAMTAVMCVCNLVFTPLFMGSPVGEVVKLLLPAIIPFNLAKAAINSVITYLVYKPISRLVFGEKEPAAS